MSSLKRNKHDPRHGAWGRMLKAATVWSTLVVALFSAGAFLFSGVEATVSVLVGGGLVIVLYVPSIWVVDFAERRSPDLSITLYLLFFVLKFVGIGFLLAVVPLPVWLSLPWGGSAGVAVVVVWQVASVYVFSQMRLQIAPAQES